MKQILLTGSNGFIGSYFKTFYVDKYNIKTFSFRNDDFQKLELTDTDVVIHLSALVHQMNGAAKKEYEKINIVQTLDLAKKAKQDGVKHFVFMSSIKVCGEETDISYSENTKCHPENDYGESKLKAEQELIKLENDVFKVSIIRTPIVYGYGVKANMKNLVNLVRKVHILPFKDIQNKRSMVYIGNLCHLIDEIITQEREGIFLAADDEALSTSKLVEYISKSLNTKVYLVKIPFFARLLKIFKSDLYKRLYESLEVDNSKTKKILNFKNLYSTEEGIKIMIQGILENDK